MSSQRRKLAPFGIYLSILALVTAGVLYALNRSFDLPVQIALGAVPVGIALAVLLDPWRARELLTGRQARYGSNALIMTLAFLGILVVVNFLLNRHSIRWDLTQDKEFTLSEQSIQIVQSLKEPVTAQAFFSVNYPTDMAARLLDSYKYAGGGMFDYEFIDPVQNPVAAQAARVSRDGTIVLKMGENQEQVTYADEQEMSSALLKLSNPGERVIYFTTGHGEYNPEGGTDFPYTLTRTTLENKNYTLNLLNLAATPQVPQNAQAVVIAGPQRSFADEEVASLKNFVDGGGALIVLSEPNLDPETSDQQDPLAGYLNQAWGIRLDNDLVIDPEVQQLLVAVADPNAYGSNPITQKLQQMTTLYPTARSIQFEAPSADVIIEELIRTYPSAWGETNIAGLQQSELIFDGGEDLPGPLTIGVAATHNQSKARLVVIGDADFASDSQFTSYANGDVIINAVDWASQQESLINLTPRTTTERMMLPPQNFSIGLVFLLSVVLIPGGILLAGILTWLQRRKMG